MSPYLCDAPYNPRMSQQHQETTDPVGSTEQPIGRHTGAPVLNCQGSTWTIRLNRPEEHNRLDPLDVDALLEFFRQPFATDNAAAHTNRGSVLQPTALVITGNACRSFSSGYTLDAITTELDDRFEQMLDALEQSPFLTIAAINGNVFGGATDLALCCDIRIGQTGTRLLMPAANIGLHYYPGGLRRYVTRLGLGTASRLMLTGLPMPAQELLRVGYLTDLVEPDDMQAAVDRYTQAATQTEPNVIREMKAGMLSIADSTRIDDQLMHRMQAAYQASARSDALAQRVEQMLEKAQQKRT